jgi:hypothetical protein
MVKETNMFEAMPPGFTTSTRGFPGLPMTPAGTKAVSCVASTKVVASTEPPICTVAPGRNPVPLIVSVKPAVPAVAELGFRLAIVGPPAAAASKGNASARQALLKPIRAKCIYMKLYY